MTSNSELRGGPHWAPTGDRIFFSSPGGFAEVAGPQTIQFLPFDKPADSGVPIASRDGKSIFYTQGRQIWRQDSGAAKPELLITSSSYPHFVTASPDGKSLFYTQTYPEFELCKLSLLSRELAVLQQGLHDSFAVTDRWIYFILKKDDSLYRMPVTGGAAALVGRLTALSAKRNYGLLGVTVSNDDSRLIYGLSEDDGQDLMLIPSVH